MLVEIHYHAVMSPARYVNLSERLKTVVRTLTIDDIINNCVKMPFTNKSTWQAIQHECQDLRRTHAHLTEGTRPSRKSTQIPDVKRYLQNAIVASDGLLVVRDNLPFQPTRERVIIPRQVLDGLLTALHIRVNHPSGYQLKKLFCRYSCALDIHRQWCTACDFVMSPLQCHEDHATLCSATVYYNSPWEYWGHICR